MPELTLDYQSAADKCPHCGRDYPVSLGSVYEDGSPRGLYIAGMHACRFGPIVVLAIAIAAPKGKPPSAVTLQVVPSETEFEMSIVDPGTSPWKGRAFLGRMLTREEMLSDPLRDEFFRIADAVVLQNPGVNRYLSE
jgi:hypothetical protein